MNKLITLQDAEETIKRPMVLLTAEFKDTIKPEVFTNFAKWQVKHAVYKQNLYLLPDSQNICTVFMNCIFDLNQYRY